MSPTSPIPGKLAGYRSVNAKMRAYYLIRSYMQRFAAAGLGRLVLGPGRYVISNTIHVPSTTTIRLSADTTLVKGTKTGDRGRPRGRGQAHHGDRAAAGLTQRGPRAAREGDQGSSSG